jgi:Helix-turn-helix domain
VTIGEALAQARRQAGLSVAQVSQKTRIREAIIRDIERDDYSSCGADFYARGHIRAMARAVGADSEVLIQQYDAERSGAVRFAGGQVATVERPAAEKDEFGPDGFAASEEFGAPDDPRPEEFGPGGSGAPEEPGAEDTGGFAVPEVAPGGFATPDYLETGAFAAPPEGEFGTSGEFGVPDEGTAPEETTAPNRVVTTSQMATFDDIMASRPAAGPERRAAQRSRPARPTSAQKPSGPDRVVVVAAVVALAIFGGLAYLLVAGTGSTPRAGATAQHQATSGRRHHGAANSPTATAPGARAAVLTPVRAVAFGPGGPPHGDNPQNAGLAIDRRRGTAWQTDWYATSHFGNLKAGTGLLLDMGHRVTITSARITLGAMAGADFQLRAGGLATLAGMRPVARAVNAHGVVRLHLARPAHARYALIWFTQLPPDPVGSYQAQVFNVRLLGNP